MLRPFFSYYGGKWRAAPAYPKPEYDTIVEPFAGAAGYSVRHYQKKVILCDIDPIVFGVWHYLISATPSEILVLPDLQPGQSVDDLAVHQEARWLIGFWINRATSTPRKTPSKWMLAHPASHWGSRVRERIASQVEMIRHWGIHNCTYSDCPAPRNATWFIDPPYQIAGVHYRHGSKGIDYPQLATWCRSRVGQVIVCENTGATWLPFAHIGDFRSAKNDRRSAESVWIKTTDGRARRQFAAQQTCFAFY